MINRTKSAVLKLRFIKGICTTRSFSETDLANPSSSKKINNVVVVEDRMHEACMFLNKHNNKLCTIKAPLCDKTMMEIVVSKPDIATYNSLIDAHCVKGEIHKARLLVDSMDLSPDTATYTSLLNGFCNAYNNNFDDPTVYANDNNVMDDAMMLIYHQMTEKGFTPDCVTYNRMIQCCFSSGLFEDAHTLLQDLLAQEGQTLDTCTYCDILRDLFRKQQVAEALSLFDLLDEQEEDSKLLNSDTYVLEVLLDGLMSCGEFDFARELYEGLGARGIKPTPEIYDIMLFSFFFQRGLINEAKLFLEMEENHCWPTTDTYNILLSKYLKNKCYDDVKKVLLYKMKTQKHYLYNRTLSMLCASVLAGSLDATLSNLINKLAR